MSSGSFGDFLNSLREFESGVSFERIEQNRAEVTRQVGEDRFEAFENGGLTLADLQYSSENTLGFVGYQFGEPILIDLGYYKIDATSGVNDFSGTFTGKNGVNSLDDLKSNVQEQIILDEFQLNLERIETGLENAGQSLDDFIGRSIVVTDTDGSQTTVELSLTGILASAHLRGAFGTLDLLLNSVGSTDDIGASDVQFIQQFGGFDAPSVADLRANTVEPLQTDATLTIDTPFEAGPSANDLNGGSEPALDQANRDDEASEFAEALPPLPEPVASSPSAGPVEGANLSEGVRGDAATEQIRSFNRDAEFFTVAATEGADIFAPEDVGDAFDSGVAAGSDVQSGSRSNDIIPDDTRSSNVEADRFVFFSGDENDIIRDFQIGLDRIDVSTFNNGLTVELTDSGGNTVVRVGDVVITLENVEADELSDSDFIGASFNEDSDGDGAELAALTTDPGLIG